ncbi:MAG: type IV pilus secretin PilQ [Steroidobacteraceae bacterium]|jgi:type IV pilus assembly protein PilQ|nr:type IV pilus secretin PilQ [Steroidobacteraceae bacterium]
MSSFKRVAPATTGCGEASADRGRVARRLLAGLVALGALCAQSAFAQNRLESIQASVQPGNRVELTLRLSDEAPTPLTFTVDNPARIALDLPDTSIAMPSRRVDVKQGVLDTVNVAEANGRTRVVLNVDHLVPYDTRVQGDTIVVSLGGAVAHAAGSSSAMAAAAAAAPGAQAVGGRSISNVDFRRGADGSGRVIVELTDARIPADLRQEGGRIVVNFANTAVPAALLQRLDVVDFATPVNAVDVMRAGRDARLVIAASGDYEQLAYQSDNIYTVEIKPVEKLPPELQDRREYTGERLTLNFQDIETRAVLQLLADTSGQNMVISDTVGGNVTLRLQNVPWDQALDIVMRTKGLDMRQDGNVMFVAPAAEIAAREKELLAARQQVQELAPLRTDYLQINYAKASDLAALIKSSAGGSLLSERGGVAIDERTNTLLLQDTAERLADIRRLVSTLDIPVRQVQIEARIVIVNDDFSRDLGVRFGATVAIDHGGSDGRGVIGTPGFVTEDDEIPISRVPGFNMPGGFLLPDQDDRWLVNLPVSSPAGRIATTLLDSDYIVDLELSAAQAEGRGEIISSPRLVTANQREATIEQGVEIPYQESSSSGATTTSFKKAVLSLRVTPQITPDNRVILDLTVAKDSVGQVVPSATGGFVPSIDTREITTQVLVNDGQTVVLGGILETERRDAEKKVPLLGDIPLLGYLFKSNSKTDNKDELLIFVTPRILREGASLY